MAIRTILGLTFALVVGVGWGYSPQVQAEPEASEKSENAEAVKKGAKIFAQNCAVCHGKTGKGDGPAGKSLKPPPRDFTKGVFKYSKNDAELLAFIKKGKPPMPSWEKTLKAEQIKDVIAFIHSLKETKSESN